MVDWIDVDEWKPEVVQDVLVLIYGKDTDVRAMAVGYIDSRDKWMIYNGSHYDELEEVYEVTHWTLLPRMPRLI